MQNPSGKNTYLDLGRFALRPIDEVSTCIEVGQFWKRKQAANNLDSPISSHNSNNNISHSKLTQSTLASISSGNESSQILRSQENTTTLFPPEHLELNLGLDAGQFSSRDSTSSFMSQLTSNFSEPNNTTKHTSQLQSIENSHESIEVIIENENFIISDNDTTTSGFTTQSNDNLTNDSAFHLARRTKYPKKLPYDKIMAGVVFVLSGFQHPIRGIIKETARSMGAVYRPEWNSSCTHLICRFKNTPKYNRVIKNKGRIMREFWVYECSKQRQLIDWRKYKLGTYQCLDSEVDDNDTVG